MSIWKSTGDFQRENLIKTQRRVLKCGKKMQRWTRARGFLFRFIGLWIHVNTALFHSNISFAGSPILFVTMMESSTSHQCSTRHRATLVPLTLGVPPSRGCCDTVPALTRCGLPQQSPPGLGSTKTHRRSQQRRKAAQQCIRIATEVREVLELYRLDLDRVRSLWQQDRVAGTRKSLRKQSVTTTGSTLSSLPECSDESSNRDEGGGGSGRTSI